MTSPSTFGSRIVTFLGERPGAYADEVAAAVGCSTNLVYDMAAKHGLFISRRKKRHGHGSRVVPDPTYRVWKSVKARIFNPKAKSYAQYGGRGITMAAEWVDDFAAFLRDMGHRPSLAHSIDRIDGDGNYEPGNCRWATPAEQARNRSVTHILVVDGEGLLPRELADRIGISADTIRQRLSRGWSLERIISTPARQTIRRAA